MFRLLVVSVAIAACSAQLVDPKDAKILKEQRFNAGDGRAGAAFATEDGHVFREETDINGDRVGEYSYIGEDGQTYTVKYSAGKDGFRVLEGSHIPSNGQQAAAFNAESEVEEPAPVQQQVPVQSVQIPVIPREPVINDYDDVEDDPNRNPFVNPHDPTHRDFAFNINGGSFAPKNAPAVNLGANLVPDCANCAGVNPFVNPFDASHTQAGLLAGHQAGFQAPQQTASIPVVRTLQQTTTTTSPRFFPPGQIKLNRFETGFNFDFSS